MRAPPFSRELLRARKSGATPNLFIHAGEHAWERARSRPAGSVLLLPPGDDFRGYDWRCVRALPLTLVWWNGSPDLVDSFARHLVHSGADLVAALDAEHDGSRVVRCEPVFYRLAPRRRAA